MAFRELQHPRGPDGRFIDAPDILEMVGGLQSIGGTFDRDRRVWRIPGDQGPALKLLLDRYEGSGPRSPGLPPGVRQATDDERRTTGIPKGYPGAYVPVEGERDGLIGVGIDSKGRVKRFYSAEFQAGRARAKFERIRRLAKVRERLDARLREDWRGSDAAAAVLLVRATGLRPGSERDTGADAQAFGASTLRVEHVKFDGDGATLEFIGKGGKQLRIAVTDPEVVRMLRDKTRGRRPGDQVFGASAEQMRTYLKSVAGPDFKVKDLRTALGTAMAARLANARPVPQGKTAARRARAEIAAAVSAQLGNTAAEALKSYIDPTVFAGWPL